MDDVAEEKPDLKKSRGKIQSGLSAKFLLWERHCMTHTELFLPVADVEEARNSVSKRASSMDATSQTKDKTGPG